jgi:hypothetical protein
LLMRVGRRLLVVADNGSQLAFLSQITDPDEVATLIGQVQGEKLDVAGRTFGALFGRLKSDETSETSEVTTPAPVDESSAEAGMPGLDTPDMSSARAELSGLMEQVRLASSRFSRT